MINLLLDANLSWRLTKALPKDEFNEIAHVDFIQLPVPAKDIEIWNWAKINGYCIVTNDEDFLDLLIQKGFPPKIVLLRTGNQSTKTLSEILVKHKKSIVDLMESDTVGALEIF